MEISIVGSIRTLFGEVELIPQDRNLLQASSIEPLQFRGLMIHLWAILERTHGAWGCLGRRRVQRQLFFPIGDSYFCRPTPG
jgi:hypothetical protein